MGLKRRNPARIALPAPPQVLAAKAFEPVAAVNRQAKTAVRVSSEERRRLISVAAYRYAERNGFSSDPVANWLRAERDIDAALARGEVRGGGAILDEVS